MRGTSERIDELRTENRGRAIPQVRFAPRTERGPDFLEAGTRAFSSASGVDRNQVVSVMIIGLTGGYCAGKNAVAAFLEARLWDCIDLDALGHDAIDMARDDIAARFGSGILGPEGMVDRRALAAVVFSDPLALADQEAIIHPIVYGLLESRLAEDSSLGRDACINGALLYRTPLAARCAAIIEVRAPLAMRLARAIRRDGASLRSALKRVGQQREIWHLRGESGRPIVVVRNCGKSAHLAAKAERALAKALDLARQAGETYGDVGNSAF
jgi:dephospho-CoA kinase